MYDALIERITRRNFDRVNRGDYDSLIGECAPDVHHRFGGDHALGGTRHDRETLRRWFGRLGRLCPDLSLDVTDVWIKGLPLRTTVIARWTNARKHPDGTPCGNHGVHVLTMRWGRVTAIDANEDSQAFAALLQQLVDAGVHEAGAEPITS